MGEIENPCMNCTSYWSAGRNCNCSNVCEKYEIYKEYKQKLESFKKDKYFNKEIKEQFKKNIDELHNKFYDNFDENIPFDQQRIIRKFVDFLKQNV